MLSHDRSMRSGKDRELSVGEYYADDFCFNAAAHFVAKPLFAVSDISMRTLGAGAQLSSYQCALAFFDLGPVAGDEGLSFKLVHRWSGCTTGQ